MTLPNALLRRMTGLLWVGLILVFGVATARAEYKISPGDILGLTVVGVPDLSVKAPVDPEGRVTFPLIGPLPVAGLTSEEATGKVQTILPGKELNRHLDDGRDIPVLISPGQISVTVSEYRPIYISGDVAKPGVIAYRPDLTVRKAIALAGGLDTMHSRLDDPVLQISELTGQYNELWVEYARWQGAVARLQAELDGKSDIDPNTFSGTLILPALSAQLVKSEQSQLKARNLDFQKERVYLAAASQRESQRADLLGQQENQDLEGLKIDTADLQRYEELFRKGAVAVPALSEARRTVLASSTRALQTSVALASVQREQGEVNRRLERLDDVRRVDLLKELGEATTTLAGTRTKLQTVSTKMRYLGIDKSHVVKDVNATKITLTRMVDGKLSHFKVDPDEALQPGDVVEVLLDDTQS